MGLIDTGGNFLTNHIISVEHVESSNSSQITSSSELQTISLTIPGSTSIGIQELLVQSGNLSSTINFWTSNGLAEGSTGVSFSITDFPETNAGELFNGSVYYQSLGGPFTTINGNELLITSIPWNNTNLVLNVQQLSSGLYSPGVTLDFQAFIPFWVQSTGNYTMDITIRNSSLYQDASVQQFFSVTEPVWNYDLIFTGNDTGTNRLGFGEQSTDTVELSLQGVSLVNLEMEVILIASDGQQQILVSQSSVTQTTFQIPFSATFGTALGNATLELTFYRQSQIVQVIQSPVFIYDLISVQITLDPPVLEAGENVDIEVFTFEEDTLLPLPADVTITDSLTSITIFSENTPVTGQIIRTIQIPDNITTGARYWYVEINPLTTSQVYRGQTISLNQSIFGNTEIQLVDPPLQVVRGDNIVLKANIMSDGLPVSEGTLYLKDTDNSTLGTFTVNGTAEYFMLVSDSLPTGQNSFVWEYSGSANFQAASTTQSIIVLSRPHFDSVQINTTQIAPDDWVEISGSLLEENNSPVSLVTVEFWKITSTAETYLQDLTVDVDGNFTHQFQMTANDAIGIHAFELRFMGDSGRYYLPSAETPRLEVSRNQVLNLIFDTDESGNLYHNQLTTVHVEGRIFGHYIIEYNTSDSGDWISLTELILNETGLGSTDVFLPDYYGLISFRVTDTLTGDNITIDTTLYIIPQYSIELLEPSTTATESMIRVSSSVEYRVYIDGFAISPPGLILIDETVWNHTFIAPGTHQIRLVFENDFVAEPFVEKEVFIAQGISLEIFAPESITEGTQATIGFRLTTDKNLPLENMEISIERRLFQYIINDNETITSELLALGITELDGSVTLYPQIIGSTSSLYIKVKANSGLYIIDTVFEFPAQILRQLEIDLTTNEIIGLENIPTNLRFSFSYKYVPEEVASLIPVTIQVNKGGTVIAEYTLASNNQGEVNIQLPAEFEVGTYTLTIVITDSAFIPMTETRTLIIKQGESLQTNQDTSILATFVTTIGFLGVLAVSFKRYTKS